MDNSSVAEGNGDLNAVAASLGKNNNNNTPISSPQRAPPSRSPRKTPTSHNRPKKTQKSNEINTDILKIDDDVMHKNHDAGEDGNIDGGGIDLPLDISNIFEASIDNNISTDGTTNVDDGDLFSALSMLVMGDGSSSNSSMHIQEPPSISGISPRTTAMDIPDDVKNRFRETRFTKSKFQFTGSKNINGDAGTVRAGFKTPISSEERKAINAFHEFNKYAIFRTVHEDKSRPKMTRGFNGPLNRGVEELVHYKCEAAACRCEMKIARYDDVNGGSHILCYELVDEGTGQPFEHSNHDMSREQQKQCRKPNKQSKSNVETTKSKYSGMTMNQSQMEFIAQFEMGNVAIGDYMAVARAMSSNGLVNAEQAQNMDGLANRIQQYVTRRKQTGDPNFVNDSGKKDMSGDDCKAILDALKIPTSDRDAVPSPLQDVPFAHSTMFMDIWKKVEVVDHDYNGEGSSFSYILLQYDDALVRARLAASMYEDNGVQLEMDFFVGVCPNDEFQMGHIGLSDKGRHKYWILAAGIFRSENNVAAGLILQHALKLLETVGGKGNRVLVDGGKALSKAVKNENELRGLLEKVKLELRRCLAHCLRRPFSRGGGYRGGKGSVHRALLDNKVPQKLVGKIVGLLLMMTFIPPNEIEAYETAIDLLIEEYGTYLSPTFRAQYLTKNPNDLGGFTGGRSGEVLSNNGGESRGKYIKLCRKQVMAQFGRTDKSKNPLYLIAAMAMDGLKKQNNISNFAVKPNRELVRNAYEPLRKISKYKLPDPNKTGGNVQPFCSDWIYSLCTVNIADEFGNTMNTAAEVPLSTVLGKDGAEFKLVFPSYSALFTELKLMLLEDASMGISAPMSMQMNTMSVESIRDMLKDPRGCTLALAKLDPTSSKMLQERVRRRLRNNTAQKKDGENSLMFLQRVAQRDESDGATKRFAKLGEMSADEKPNKKKSSNKSTSDNHKNMLEKEKWGEEKEDEMEELEDLIGECDFLDNIQNAEAEDLERIFEESTEMSGGNDGVAEVADTFVFDQMELAELNSRVAESSERVRVLRELGEGPTVSVGKECKNLCCNCEMFNRWSICKHVVWIEVLHFGKFPPGNISQGEDGWEFVRKRILDIIEVVSK